MRLVYFASSTRTGGVTRGTPNRQKSASSASSSGPRRTSPFRMQTSLDSQVQDSGRVLVARSEGRATGTGKIAFTFLLGKTKAWANPRTVKTKHGMDGVGISPRDVRFVLLTLKSPYSNPPIYILNGSPPVKYFCQP